MTNPTFGEKKQDVTYVNRYGVYAVIPNKDKDQMSISIPVIATPTTTIPPIFMKW